MGVDWSVIDKKYPSKLDKSSMSIAEWRKQRTLELYSYLPQTSLEDRFKYTDIRDAVIELNYKFFGYIASHHYIANNYISYEDKFQSAALHFCEMWPKFQYAAKYRTDLSFAVFFKPRITECMERELEEVKYSVRRSLCMEAGEQVGKHWAQVTYDDLKDVKLPPEKMASLKCIFGALYSADLETFAMFVPGKTIAKETPYASDEYNSLTDMLVHEMVIQERELTDKDLLGLAEMLDVPFAKLKSLVPDAMKKLYDQLITATEVQETFS